MKNIVFCVVECDRVNDAVQANNINSIPQFNFYFNGKEHAKFVGADEKKFRTYLDELSQMSSSKAGSHKSMQFK